MSHPDLIRYPFRSDLALKMDRKNLHSASRKRPIGLQPFRSGNCAAASDRRSRCRPRSQAAASCRSSMRFLAAGDHEKVPDCDTPAPLSAGCRSPHCSAPLSIATHRACGTRLGACELDSYSPVHMILLTVSQDNVDLPFAIDQARRVATVPSHAGYPASELRSALQLPTSTGRKPRSLARPRQSASHKAAGEKHEQRWQDRYEARVLLHRAVRQWCPRNPQKKIERLAGEPPQWRSRVRTDRTTSAIGDQAAWRHECHQAEWPLRSRRLRRGPPGGNGTGLSVSSANSITRPPSRRASDTRLPKPTQPASLFSWRKEVASQASRVVQSATMAITAAKLIWKAWTDQGFRPHRSSTAACCNSHHPAGTSGSRPSASAIEHQQGADAAPARSEPERRSASV